ncbi:putative indoleamine 2-3-dioxygenase family protein [Venturia nashicola]|nr:putative indoleamine 2-3-dioxygenase family protein [Venturia nashicola]
MLPPLSLNLAAFDISPENGFLPTKPPLTYLGDSYYQPWEDLISDLPSLISRRQVRAKVSQLPVLATTNLNTEPQWQRAYMILGFLTHAYIWSDSLPSQTLPPQISIPFLAVADHFDLPTTASYSATNLWNYAPLSPGLDLCQPDNLRCLVTFTGTKDEEWFYLISVAMEARGGRIVTEMLAALDAARSDQADVVAAALTDFAETIKELGILLAQMYKHCDPYVFYYDIRPMLAGSKNMAHAGLPKGVWYDEGEGNGQWREYSGGSNAQSSLLQFFDMVLGVEHKATGASDPKKKQRFLQEMRRYMPSGHAAFLAHLMTQPSLRDFVIKQPVDNPVTTAYNAAVTQFGLFREIHIQIVTRYIILPSKNPRTKLSTEASVNLATASLVKTSVSVEDMGTKDGGGITLELHGTGGTALIPFLKQTRDETNDAAMV